MFPQNPLGAVVDLALQYQLVEVLHLTTRRAVIDDVVCASAALLLTAFRHPELREKYNQLAEADAESGLRMPDYKAMFTHELRKNGPFADDIAALCAVLGRYSPVRLRLSRNFGLLTEIAVILSTVVRFPVLSREVFVLLREAGVVGVVIRLLTSVEASTHSGVCRCDVT
jgi:hypothetical protein